jgi:hypothetical protein
MGLGASLSSCSQWLEVPGEPAMADEDLPRVSTLPQAPPPWQPPLEGSRYFGERSPSSIDQHPPPSDPPVSAVPPLGQSAASSRGSDGGALLAPGEPPLLDAGTSRPDEAGSGVDAASPPPPPPPACAGEELFDICWYLGEPGASCEQTCAGHGGLDVAVAAYVGTERQGGSREDCVLILNALGQRYRVRSIESEEGVGCHLAGEDADPYWVSYPAFQASACLRGVRIVCGCSD